jgi:hypothetical protein
MQVEGLIFNGVQSGYGLMPDAMLFTHKTTGSTFGVPNATPEKVAAYRDAHMRKWLRREAEAAAKQRSCHVL